MARTIEPPLSGWVRVIQSRTDHRVYAVFETPAGLRKVHFVTYEDYEASGRPRIEFVEQEEVDAIPEVTADALRAGVEEKRADSSESVSAGDVSDRVAARKVGRSRVSASKLAQDEEKPAEEQAE